MSILEEIAAERRRQIDDKGYTATHDRQYGNGELGRAAAFYAALHAAYTYTEAPDYGLLTAVDTLWPWHANFRKPGSPRENLVRAGALILAEIERLDTVPDR